MSGPTPSSALDVLIATGPIFSVSRLIGRERTRRLEELLLGSFETLLRLAPVLLLLVSSVGVLFTVLIGIEVLRITFLGGMDRAVETAPWFILLLLLCFVFLVLRWELHFVYDYGRAICQRWRSLRATRPPWPISDFEAPFHYGVVLAFTSIYLLPLTLLYLVVVPTAWVCACALLIPFWGAEKLRVTLTPESPNHLDILAYLISLLAMVHRLFGIWGII